jgi:universal stress protein E
MRAERSTRKILVAIRDVQGSSVPLLRKVAAIAGRGAKIELMHVLTGPVTVAISGIRQPRGVVQHAMQAKAQRAAARLRQLARSSALRGRHVDVHVTWDTPVADAIVRRARKIRADFMVAGIQPRQFAGRFLLANTDWELIREAPCPLLIVRPAGQYGRRPVIAAIDPFHANDKPARLDARLLETARSLAARLGGEAHVFHAYVPLAALMSAFAVQPMPIAPPAAQQVAYRLDIQRRFDVLATRARIPTSHRHLHAGDVLSQLAAVVRKTRAQIVVMGAVSRSALKRVFVGNTAERVLDKLPCDLVVVKPR